MEKMARITWFEPPPEATVIVGAKSRFQLGRALCYARSLYSRALSLDRC
jgi:hypothetical protein